MKNNKLTLPFIILFLWITACFPSELFSAYLDDNSQEAPELAYERYDSPDDRFSIDFPIHWDLTFQENSSSLAAVSPPDDPYDNFRENILASSFHLSSTENLMDYFAGNLAFLKSKIPSIKILESKEIELDGYQAVKLVYASQMGEYSYRTIQIFLLKGGRGYILTFMAEENRFEDYVSTFHHVLGSFSFKPGLKKRVD